MGMTHPACFTVAQYTAWKRAAVACYLKTRSEYCTDCTPAYKYVMRQQGRCEHPGVTFHRDADGDIVGKRPGGES